MSDRLLARALGLCVAVVGGCILTLNGIGLFDAIALVLSVIVAIWKLVWYILGTGLAFIGVIWVLKPQRVFETIKRNQEHKNLTGRA